MLVSQNKEMAAMLVSQTKLLGIELYFYANTFFCFSKPIIMTSSHVNENALYVREVVKTTQYLNSTHQT